MNQKIYIVLTQTGTKFSRFLRYATNYSFNHVSISFHKDLTEMYSFGRRNMYLPFIAGLVRENPGTGVFQKYADTTICCIYELSVTQQQYDAIISTVGTFLQEQEKYKYNFMGLVAMKMNIPLYRKHHFVCSQFVAYVLENAGAVDFEKQSMLVVPQDFTEVENITEVYTGNLSQYYYCIA